MPFCTLSDPELQLTLSCINYSNKIKTNEPPDYLKNLFKNMNNVSNPTTKCKYLDINELNNSINPYTEIYIHLNIASLPFHINDLSSLISTINTPPMVIGITESNLYIEDLNITDITLQGYNIEHCPTESKKGGALLYLHCNLNYIVRGDLLIYASKLLESVFVEVINPNKNNTIFGCIYRHPSLNPNEFILNHLNPLLEKLSYEKKNIVLMGDFNIDLLSYRESQVVSNYFESLCSHSLFPTIILPTRVTLKTKTLIDNIFMNSFSDNMSSGNLTISISDHLAQFVCIPGKPPIKNKIKSFRRNLKKFDTNTFIEEISNINWELHIKENDSVNESINFFLKTFENVLNRHAPYKELTKKQIKLHSKPWITSGILKSIYAKNILYKKFINSKNDNIKNVLFTQFKFYRNKICNLLRHSKKSYYTSFFSNNLNNVKNTWKGIKEIINIKPSTNIKSFSLKVNEKVISDHSTVANLFNNYFSTIQDKLLKEIVPSKYDFTNFLKTPNNYSFFIDPVTENEVSNLIKDTLKNNKALGPNSLPTFLLKLIPHIISKPLCTMMNNSFKNGIFPEAFKVAKVIPIHKMGSHLNYSNYRPISLLSNLSKLFEKAMFHRLNNFLEKHKCIYKHQYGFRNKHSTTHALIEITEKIRQALDNKNFACGVFIDIQKAFDTVDHKILLCKLQHYGVRGIPLCWFSSYLYNRKQFVSINGIKSELANSFNGVPQGSVLGPLLFLLFINDLNVSLKFSTAYHFADDTNLLHINKSLKNLNKNMNHDLASIVQWLRSNKLSLNSKKTEIIIFKSIQTKINKYLNFRLSGQKLNLVNSIKYLGIKIDSNLSFTSHLQDLALKLSRANGMLAKIRHFVNHETLLNIYYAIFHTHLIYACQVWGQSHHHTFLRLTHLQNKALKIIYFQNTNSNSNILYYLSKVLKLHDLIQLSNCLFVWNQHHNNLPLTFSNFFNYRDNLKYILRSTSNFKLSVPKYRTVHFGYESIQYKSIKTWNNLPTQLKSLKSLPKFKTGLFNYLSEKYCL
jgi:hypothetical protein